MFEDKLPLSNSWKHIAWCVETILQKGWSVWDAQPGGC